MHGRGSYGGPPPRDDGPGAPYHARSSHGYGHGPPPQSSFSSPQHQHHPPPFRPPPPFSNSHHSTSRTYPLTKHFGRYLSGGPSVVPGGRMYPSAIERSVSERLAKLDVERRKLEAELADRQERKRAGLRRWENMERETARDGLRTELAEQHVRAMGGEGHSSGPAF
ncbi:MAG: hypothetical protein M1826_002189 [Phylliscum demangeonii]|nr:MAG: hypothetical protein M1826_002189 [Phylliscum demangeonii]